MILANLILRTFASIMMEKNEAILNYVIRWLDDNIDNPPPEGTAEDSANLKEKINIAQDPRITVADIESGIF